MKKPCTAPYLVMLLLSVLAVFAIELFFHLQENGPAATPLHSHLSLAQFAIILFCFLFYVSDRMQLFQLSLRLCFLSLFLVWARILFELQTGRFSANIVETGLLVFAGLVLLGLTRHPVRKLEQRQFPS